MVLTFAMLFATTSIIVWWLFSPPIALNMERSNSVPFPGSGCPLLSRPPRGGPAEWWCRVSLRDDRGVDVGEEAAGRAACADGGDDRAARDRDDHGHVVDHDQGRAAALLGGALDAVGDPHELAVVQLETPLRQALRGVTREPKDGDGVEGVGAHWTLTTSPLETCLPSTVRSAPFLPAVTAVTVPVTWVWSAAL